MLGFEEVGLDHLAFAVASRVDLEQWADRLARAGVDFLPIAESFTIPSAAVLVFAIPTTSNSSCSPIPTSRLD